MSLAGCLLITGGTGSFGNAVLQRILNTEVSEIRIFSRDEKKQDELRSKYGDSRINFFIGDTREYQSVARAMKGVDFVFHAAALKQVPSCEFFPLEAVKTNILGTENVLTAAVAAHVKRVICLSTDKAVYPINAMGMSKALMEKVMIANARSLADSQTVLCATRYGNVMASRGSVIPRLLRQIASGKPMTLTDPSMTRFMMSLDEAIDLVLYAFENGQNGDVFVQKSPAATIQILADALRETVLKHDYPIEIIGTRHGEKQYEVLLSREEMAIASSSERYFRVPLDDRDLNYESYFSSGNTGITTAQEYTSHNTRQLDRTEMAKMLAKLEVVAAFKEGRQHEEMIP
jgi:UDP-N-acetylglucosamine 4,6-dehydratase